MKRGYLLLEVAVGGAMIAVVAATLLSTLADSRVKNVAAGRDVIASQLALEKIEQQRALGFAKVGTDAPVSCSTAGVTESPVSGQPGNYKRTCTLGVAVSTTLNAAPSAVTVQCKKVTVTVQFTMNTGGAGISATTGVRSNTLISQVCQ